MKNKKNMIFSDELRVWIENRYGKQINSKSDTQKLRDIILDNHKEYLSESTIRRFFNLIPSGKTSRTTFDIFSRYVGFTSYLHFCDFCQQLIKEVANSNVDKVALTGLDSKKNISIFEVNLIANRIIQILKEEDIDLLETYFNNVSLFELIKANKSINDLFAQTIGPYFSLKSNRLDFIRILNTKYFIPLILYCYVDVNNKGLEKYYQWLFVNGKTQNQYIFSASILALNSVLNNQWYEAKFYYEKIEQSDNILSAPLQGRIALLNWIFSSDFDALLKQAEKFQKEILHFSVDIIPYMIVSKNREYLQKWFCHFPHIIDNNISWVERDLMYITKMAKCVADGENEHLKNLLEEKTQHMNSYSLFNSACKIIKEMNFVQQ